MSLRDRVCHHLSGYRANTLGISEQGVFIHRGREHLKGHILPIQRKWENLLEPYRDRFRTSEHSLIKLHRYFHHLNSSQALCINLFFPLLEEKKLEWLFEYLELQSTEPLRANFEFESSLEVADRRTSFDFHVCTGRAEDLFIEVKYTEDGFGRAPDDLEHKEKFHATYAPLLKDNQFIVSACKDVSFFLKNYQVLRNLVHITDSSHVVFLYPAANTKVAEQAALARDSFLTDAGRDRLRLIVLDDFVESLLRSGKQLPLGDYYAAFKEKYLGFAR